MPDQERSVLKLNLKTETDRNLLVGILDRKKDIVPVKNDFEYEMTERSDEKSEELGFDADIPRRQRNATQAFSPLSIHQKVD